MIPAGSFGVLLLDLWRDLQEPQILWQAGVLLACFALASVFDRWLQERVEMAVADAGRVRRLGQRGLQRVALPLAMLLLVLAVRPLLAYWHNVNLLKLAIPLLLSLVVIRSVMFVVRQGFHGAAPWLASFERSFALFAWFFAALYILGLLPEFISALESVSFSIGKESLNLWQILQGMGAVLATLLVALWIGGMVDARLMNAQGIDGNLRLVFSRLLRALLILLAILLSLPMVGIDLTALSVFGGALGVGLGLGLQRIAANYVSGFIILLDRSIRIGSLIDVAGMRGVVTRITTRYTLLRGMTGVEMIIPNDTLVSSAISNETLTDPQIRVATQVQVAYSADLERAMRILVEAANAQPRVLAAPPPKAFLVAFADSGITLELGFWIADPEQGSLQIKSDIHLTIWRAFKEAGIEIPFPQREVRLLNQ